MALRQSGSRASLHPSADLRPVKSPHRDGERRLRFGRPETTIEWAPGQCVFATKARASKSPAVWRPPAAPA
jgi:hypothetical protein